MKHVSSRQINPIVMKLKQCDAMQESVMFDIFIIVSSGFLSEKAFVDELLNRYISEIQKISAEPQDTRQVTASYV